MKNRKWSSMTDIQRANYLAERALHKNDEVAPNQAGAVFWVVTLGLLFLYWLVN